MKSTRLAGIVFIMLLIAGAVLYMQSSAPASTTSNTTDAAVPATEAINPAGTYPVGTSENDTPETPIKTGETTGQPTTGLYTMAAIAAHASASSCWSVIDGGVYDLTDWISKHPGGEPAIKQLCGKDGSDLFHGQHGANERQASILADYKIGVLAE